MRVMRANYDKPHRCPTWSGPALVWSNTDAQCESGSIQMGYEKRFWSFKVNRCGKCGVYVLPVILHWFDWRYIANEISSLKYRWDMYRS